MLAGYWRLAHLGRPCQCRSIVKCILKPDACNQLPNPDSIEHAAVHTPLCRRMPAHCSQSLEQNRLSDVPWLGNILASLVCGLSPTEGSGRLNVCKAINNAVEEHDTRTYNQPQGRMGKHTHTHTHGPVNRTWQTEVQQSVGKRLCSIAESGHVACS